MALTKCIIIFEHATNVSTPSAPARRLGGWSEGWYLNESTPEATRAEFNSLCVKRAALLGLGSASVAQRYQLIGNEAPTQLTSFRYPGRPLAQNDIPQMALLCRVPGAGVVNTKQMLLRGIPDFAVIEGEYSPSDAYNRALKSFFRELEGFKFKAKDLSLTKYAVDNISALGVMQTEVNNPYVVGDYIRILRTQDANDNLVGGRYRVSTVVAATSVTLQGWDKGACKGGKVIKDAIVYPSVDFANVRVSRITTRRVGKPFTGYVGRHSKKN